MVNVYPNMVSVLLNMGQYEERCQKESLSYHIYSKCKLCLNIKVEFFIAINNLMLSKIFTEN